MKQRHSIYTAICAGILLTAPILTAVTGVQAAEANQASTSSLVSSASSSQAAQSTSSSSVSQSSISSTASSQIASSSQSTAKVAQSSAPSASTASAKETTTVTAPLKTDYQAAITAGANQILGGDYQSAWGALAIVQAGIKLTDSQKEAYRAVLKADVESMISDDRFTPTDLERTAIGVTAIGDDATNFDGINLIAKITENIKKTGINGQIFAIVALSMKDYGAEANQTIDDMIQALLKAQNQAGGWSFGGSESDLDITGMAMTALGMHRDQAGVQTAMDRATAMLKTTFLKDTGGFLIPSAFSKIENANSIAMTIMGLMANDVDPATIVGDNGANPISRLLAFQKADGQFRWVFDSDMGALAMSTEQSVYALDQYQFMKAGKGSIYNFKTAAPVDPVDPTDSTDPTDPTDPVDPVDPVDPTDPVEPITPTNPTTTVDATLVNKSLSATIAPVKDMVATEIKNGQFTGSDVIFGAARTNQLSKVQIKTLYNQMLVESKAGNISRPNDIARVILNLQAMGINPTEFAGRNLVNELYQTKDVTKQGTYMTATILLALVSGHYQAPTNAQFTVKDLVQYLVTEADDYGNAGWGYETDGVFIKDLDTTAIATIALKTTVATAQTYPLTDQLISETNELLKNSTAYIQSAQMTDGGFGYAGATTSNSNSTAMAIVALSTMGIDANTVKNGGDSALAALLKFQGNDGIFKADYSTSMAMGQALLAMKAYQLNAAGQGSVYDFVANPATPFGPAKVPDTITNPVPVPKKGIDQTKTAPLTIPGTTDDGNSGSTDVGFLPQTGVKTAVASSVIGLVLVVGTLGVLRKKSVKEA